MVAETQPVYKGKVFRIEDYTTGTVFVADSDLARANKAVFERHLVSEWSSDIDATMATVHPENAYQKIPSLGVDINSYDGVKEFYLGRFATWPGPALQSFTRVAITDDCIFVEGKFEIKSSGEFSGLNVAGKAVTAPCMIVLECRDRLLVGEIVYMDRGSLAIS